MSAEHTLMEELQRLPRLSRAQLARELLESLDEPERVNYVDLLWGEEAERRLANIRNGVTKTLPGQDVLTEARRLVNL
jgi:hypothetical protein